MCRARYHCFPRRVEIRASSVTGGRPFTDVRCFYVTSDQLCTLTFRCRCPSVWFAQTASSTRPASTLLTLQSLAAWAQRRTCLSNLSCIRAPPSQTVTSQASRRRSYIMAREARTICCLTMWCRENSRTSVTSRAAHHVHCHCLVQNKLLIFV